MVATHYPAHVLERQRKAEAALAAEGFDALVISSGKPFTYYADDQDAPFRSVPHFKHWAPLHGPDHLIVVRPGKKPMLIRVSPEDYWYEQGSIGEPFFKAAFDYHEVGDAAKAWALAKAGAKAAYVGDDADQAKSAGIAASGINPERLTKRLDWDRSYKTAYEVACLEEAEKLAAKGHAAARAAFQKGSSELEIHQAYVEAVGCVDKELPYESIVALDEKGATLHYQSKRAVRDGRVLLIDVGAPCNGYGSDITRTWTTPKADTLFRLLVDGLDRLQRDLCERVKPGLSYVDFHHGSHVAIADLLKELGILRIGGEDAVAKGLTLPFFPHGLGHFLGIQVHDVSGRQTEPTGGTTPPPKQYPYLRTTRTIEPDQVFTVEPGVYFIGMLLGPYRAGANAALIDWKLVDRLTPLGGVRIEDNVVVTREGHRNLTRPYV